VVVVVLAYPDTIISVGSYTKIHTKYKL